jgi:hypothetical protein
MMARGRERSLLVASPCLFFGGGHPVKFFVINLKINIEINEVLQH